MGWVAEMVDPHSLRGGGWGQPTNSSHHPGGKHAQPLQKAITINALRDRRLQAVYRIAHKYPWLRQRQGRRELSNSEGRLVPQSGPEKKHTPYFAIVRRKIIRFAPKCSAIRACFGYCD